MSTFKAPMTAAAPGKGETAFSANVRTIFSAFLAVLKASCSGGFGDRALVMIFMSEVGKGEEQVRVENEDTCLWAASRQRLDEKKSKLQGDFVAASSASTVVRVLYSFRPVSHSQLL